MTSKKILTCQAHAIYHALPIQIRHVIQPVTLSNYENSQRLRENEVHLRILWGMYLAAVESVLGSHAFLSKAQPSTPKERKDK